MTTRKMDDFFGKRPNKDGPPKKKNKTEEQKLTQQQHEILALCEKLAVPIQIGWKAYDHIAESLELTHPNDSLSPIEILAKYKHTDAKALQEKLYERNYRHPHCSI